MNTYACVTRQAREPVDGLLTAGDAPSIVSLARGGTVARDIAEAWERIDTRAGEKRAATREGERESAKGKRKTAREENSREAELLYVDIQLCNVGPSRVYFMVKWGKWEATKIGIRKKKRSVADIKNKKRGKRKEIDKIEKENR